MRAAAIAENAVRLPVCPLCHTRDQAVTPELLAAGATWTCTTCGQSWSAERLDTVAAYAQYTAARSRAV
jgi:ribosomal protein L37AE/L43A